MRNFSHVHVCRPCCPVLFLAIVFSEGHNAPEGMDGAKVLISRMSWGVYRVADGVQLPRDG